ncbi:MAG: 6-phosphogluconolactonase [Gammaproteobacteria bacterium]
MTGLAWQVCADASALARAAADRVLVLATQALAAREVFRIALAGGRTPAATYALLRDADTDWSRWHIYFTDERCVGPRDPARNAHMTRESWLDHVTVPAAQVHAIPVEYGPRVAASRYGEDVARITPFDVVMLGIGEDGHTASLFPGRPSMPEAWAVAVDDAPKPPANRVSLGLRALRATREVLVLASGPDKQSALSAWRAGAPLPIAEATAGMNGTVFVDRAAFRI